MCSPFSQISYACDKIGKFAKLYRLSYFASITKPILDKLSQRTALDAFDVLCGMKSNEIFSIHLPPNLKSCELVERCTRMGGLVEKTPMFLKG